MAQRLGSATMSAALCGAAPPQFAYRRAICTMTPRPCRLVAFRLYSLRPANRLPLLLQLHGLAGVHAPQHGEEQADDHDEQSQQDRDDPPQSAAGPDGDEGWGFRPGEGRLKQGEKEQAGQDSGQYACRGAARARPPHCKCRGPR